MKNKKIIISFLCVLLLISSFGLKCKAFVREKHDALMLDLLFSRRNDSFDQYIKNGSKNKDIKAIESACYLVIDQYNGNGQDSLDFLKKYGVRGIPENIVEIDFKSSSAHRMYTHRGWESTSNIYSGESGSWMNSERRLILPKTISKVFDFGDNEKKMDAFCAILYYIHILGDQIEAKSFKQINGLMGVGGRKDDIDIIHELLKYLPILFEEQKNTHKYSNLISELNSINKVMRSINVNIDTLEEFDKYHKCTEEVIVKLKLYLPGLLENEEFFIKTFPK